ncbi:hypothetical protein ACH3VR_18475 [Microbacterium sp. B2969]|uniref:Uncharacterized protein n=1 Tax=Microbacterium alkaliflavum TaxID=3248839 RepID=A0ABW7QE06_9MICO
MADEQLDDKRAFDGAGDAGAIEAEAAEPGAVEPGVAAPGMAEAAESSEVPPQYGVGPFSVREVALGGVWLVAFVVSFFSLNPVRFDSVWTSGLGWILTIGVPTIAVFLIALRRLSPDGIRRVGSLGVDQFASVAFSVSTVVWITYIWETVAFAIDNGIWARSWVMWVEAVLMLAGVILTVFAPLIPALCEDFRYRPEVPAHRNASPTRPVAPRPAPAPRPEPSPAEAAEAAAVAAPVATADQPAQEPYGSPYAAQPTDSSWAEPAAYTAPYQTAHTEPTVEQHAPVRHQAFWALVPEERDVTDEQGRPLWRIGPGAWALVIEDRGDVFVMRHEDGRIGYLHDTTGVTRG